MVASPLPLKRKKKLTLKKKSTPELFRTPTPSPLRAARKLESQQSPRKKDKAAIKAKPRRPQPKQRHPAFRRTPTPPPIPIPQDPEDFEEVFGKDRLDAWIFKNPDEFHPRTKLSGELYGVPEGHVLVAFRRTFCCPTNADNEGVASVFRRSLSCKLYMSVHLPSSCKMQPLGNACPGLLQIGRAEARMGGRFHPTFSPRWTTEDWGIRDLFTATFPRAEIYDVLLQAVNFEGNDESAEEMSLWLKRLVEIFPEDAEFEERARKFVVMVNNVLDAKGAFP